MDAREERDVPLSLRFRSRLERISEAAEYYALQVPVGVSRKIGMRGAVPVLARINGSSSFRGSLFPVGGGRHSMRVKASVRREVGISEGSRVSVEIQVLDPSRKDSLPADLQSSLRSAGLLAAFERIPPGRRNYLLRTIEQAVKPETRQRRIQDALAEARARRLKGR